MACVGVAVDSEGGQIPAHRLWAMIDADDSQGLSRDEWESAFGRLDANSNGVVSRKEWTLRGGDNEAFDAISSRRAVMSRLDWQRFFDVLDTDRDGTISLDEWAAQPREVNVDGAAEVEADSAAEVKAGDASKVKGDNVAKGKVISVVEIEADIPAEEVGIAAKLRVEHTVEVRTLAGSVLAAVKPVPSTTKLLKAAVESQAGRQAATQKIVMCDGFRVLEDHEELPQEPLEVFCLTDETPLWSWDLEGNPARDHIKVDGPRVTCPTMQFDVVTVITKVPMVSGRHYIEFVMHCIGDEQWCGVVADPGQAGPKGYGSVRRMEAWQYYCGRMGSNSTSLADGQGALHAHGKAITEFEKLSPSGDVIGMLVDLDAGAVAFDLNGRLQGACPIPARTPLWVCTGVDTRRDDVELRKPSLQDAPPKNLEALEGALLDISQGLTM